MALERAVRHSCKKQLLERGKADIAHHWTAQPENN
jgi:hypothetical protein